MTNKPKEIEKIPGVAIEGRIRDSLVKTIDELFTTQDKVNEIIEAINYLLKKVK